MGRAALHRMKAWLYPTGVERDYLAAIRRVQIKPLEQAIKDNILPILPSVLAAGARQDAPTPSWFDTVRDAFETTLRQANVPEAELRRIVERVSGGVDGFNRKEFNAVLKSVYRVDVITRSPPALQAALGVFEAQNIALIKSIPVQSLATLQGEIIEAVRTGQTLKDTQALIRNRYGVTDRRAKLIARDQVGKLNGQLTRLRQEEIGVTEYTWRGILDARERPEHVAREGKVFAWDKPPPDGHPGEPIQCRCSAEPKLLTFEELEERLTGQRPPEGTYQPSVPAPAPRPVPAPVPPPAPRPPPGRTEVARPPVPPLPAAGEKLKRAEPKRRIKTIEPQTSPATTQEVAPPTAGTVTNKPLTDDERSYLEYYKGDGFKKLNEVLRNPSAYSADEVDSAKKMLEKVDSAVAKSVIDKDTTLYRGIRSRELFDSADSLVGGKIPLKTPQSTATSEGSALNWSGLIKTSDGKYLSGAAEESVVFKINAKAGQPGMPMEKLSMGNTGENEMLLASGGEYRVVKVTDLKNAAGRTTGKLIEVDYEPVPATVRTPIPPAPKPPELPPAPKPVPLGVTPAPIPPSVPAVIRVLPKAPTPARIVEPEVITRREAVVIDAPMQVHAVRDVLGEKGSILMRILDVTLLAAAFSLWQSTRTNANEYEVQDILDAARRIEDERAGLR